MTTPPRTEALDKVIRNLDWHIEHKAHAGIGPIVVRHWNLLRERLTGGVAQGRVVSPQSAEELDAILNSGSNALCTVHPDGSVTTDDTCQCPKCGRMHRRLGTPPASIAAPAEAAGEAVAPVCCYCDTALSCAACGREQPADSCSRSGQKAENEAWREPLEALAGLYGLIDDRDADPDSDVFMQHDACIITFGDIRKARVVLASPRSPAEGSDERLQRVDASLAKQLGDSISRNSKLSAASSFLLERICEYEQDQNPNDFYGHVLPAIGRLRDVLSASPTQSGGAGNG